MFKPSLRISVLKEKLCLPAQKSKVQSFQSTLPEKPKEIPKFTESLRFTPKMDIPSMMLSEQLLQKTTFSNNTHHTHVFTPLSYDFRQYPKAVKQLIRLKPKAAQVGRVNQINYLVFEKSLVLWAALPNNKQAQMLKVHRFQEAIDIVEFSVLKNNTLFKSPNTIVMAISFQNRMKLFKVQQKQLKLEDLLLKYKLKSCSRIQKIHFTRSNQIVFGGDNGQISMVSFNKSKQTIVNIKRPLLQKYLSRSSFDYFTRHAIKQIKVNDQFIYCLTDRISKCNYLMYFLKKAINKVIALEEEPKYIIEETFIDIYRFSDQERKSIVFVDQLNQKEIQKRVKEGYVNFWGEGLKDGFKIISINVKHQEMTYKTDVSVPESQMKNQQPQKQFLSTLPVLQSPSPIITLITKCGYRFSLIHQSLFVEKRSSKSEIKRQNFVFFSEPNKIVQNVGQASLFQAKTVLSSAAERQYRKNFIIKSLQCNKDQNLILTNNSLLYSANRQISLIKFDDLKTGIYETTIQEEFFLSTQEFNDQFEKTNFSQDQRINLRSFPSNDFAQKKRVQSSQGHFYRMFNNQKRWTVYDNEGRFHIYLLQLKHIILTYLYYQCQLSNQYQRLGQTQIDSNSLIQSDLRLHSTLQKIIKIYGYTNFTKALIQILVNNSNSQRQYFYLQKQLFQEIVKRQFEFELPNKFQDWFYNLSHHIQANKIAPTKKMLQFVWITLFQYENRAVLSSQIISFRTADAKYFRMAHEHSEARPKLSYSSYGYALKSLFFDTIQHLLYFRAKQFKQRQIQLKKCQQKLILLSNYIDSKKLKSQTHEYKNYLSMKLNNLNKKQEKYPHNYVDQKVNKTFSTNYSTTSVNSMEESFMGLKEEKQDFFQKSQFKNHQSNQSIQKIVKKSIQKIITLVDVMSILIEKDQRQGLPNFAQIVTDFKSQIRVGEAFFKQELLVSENIAEFVHPELVRQAQMNLVELKLQDRIDYVKFKASRNIFFGSSLTETDLKSLNFDRLSSIISSGDILQLRKIFLGSAQQSSFQKLYYYSQFLSICLGKNVQKVKGLSSLKQQKFGTLSEQIKLSTDKKLFLSGTNHLTVEKIIMARQQLEYFEEEMTAIFEQIKHVFQKSVDGLKNINGSQFYEAQKYLERIIELLITNFGTEDILVQSLQQNLKNVNMIQKVHFTHSFREKIFARKDSSERQILSIKKQKQLKTEQKSTFQRLLQLKNQKTKTEQRTFASWGTNSTRN